MTYQELKEKLKNFTIFSLTDIRKIEPRFYRNRLNEWQNKGYLKKLRRGYYMFADTPLSEETLFLTANKLYGPSYVSLEMALSYHGLIPEGIYSVTSVTSKKTAKFKTPIGEFSYRSIKPGLLFGYGLAKLDKQTYKLAEIEKAVLDYLYFHPDLTSQADLEGWRFNAKEFLGQADLVKFDKYLKVYDSPALVRRAKKFISFIKRQ